ncbi:MAG: hypothetical protein RL385_2174, partial [Pseudomonadota bacterium]
RAMSGAPLPHEALMRLFEAARWAPSAMNAQPWRFRYARAETPNFQAFLDVLVPANQHWCKRAGALVAVLAKTHFDNGKPSPSHLFDAGLAYMSLALQGSQMGLVVHGLGGFDAEAARAALRVPTDHAIACFAALGYPGDKHDLPEALAARETPSPRLPVSELAAEGPF